MSYSPLAWCPHSACVCAAGRYRVGFYSPGFLTLFHYHHFGELCKVTTFFWASISPSSKYLPVLTFPGYITRSNFQGLRRIHFQWDVPSGDRSIGGVFGCFPTPAQALVPALAPPASASGSPVTIQNALSRRPCGDPTTISLSASRWAFAWLAGS